MSDINTIEDRPTDTVVDLSVDVGDVVLGEAALAEFLAYETEYARLTDAAISETVSEVIDGVNNDETSLEIVPGETGDAEELGGIRVYRTSIRTERPKARREAFIDMDVPHTVNIQEHVSAPQSMIQKISSEALRSGRDVYSVFDIPTQPDGGLGMVAMAQSYLAREQKKKAQSLRPSEPTVVWAYSQTGIELRDFLESVRELDHDGDIAHSTRAVLAVDSEEKKKRIVSSEHFADMSKRLHISVEVIDPATPQAITLPDNVGLVLLPNSLDKLAAHQVVREKVAKEEASSHIKEMLVDSRITGRSPLMRVDAITGQAHILSANQLQAHTVHQGTERFSYLHQLTGRFQPSERILRSIDRTSLSSRDRDVAEFIEDRPGSLLSIGEVFNYVPGLGAFIQKLSSQLRSDGLLYISGPMRSRAHVTSTNLVSFAGPIQSNCIEVSAVTSGVLASDTDTVKAGIKVHVNKPGQFGYLLVDRAAGNEQFDPANDTFKTMLKQGETEGIFGRAYAELDQARQSLADEKDGTALVDRAQAVHTAFNLLVEQYPQARRDTTLTLGIARLFNEKRLYDDAQAFARLSVELAPQLSGPLLERAKAEYQGGRGNYREALKTVALASRIEPTNPFVHAEAMRIYDEHPEHKAERIPAYINAAKGYLENSVDLPTDEMARILTSITEALRDDYLVNINNLAVYKTIIIEDLETGVTRRHELTVSDMKQMIAADAAVANAETIGRMRRSAGDYEQTMLENQQLLMEIWQQLVPQDHLDRPLPRDEWLDNNPSRQERWRYNGSLYESDAAVAPPLELLQKTEDSHAEVVVAPDSNEDRDEYPRQSLESMKLGEELNEANKGDGTFYIDKQTLPGHMFLTGRTREGKTTMLKSMFEQLPDMNVNFWGFDLGDKSELTDVAAHLNAKGIRTVVIRPGDKNSIPVSVDFLTPVEGCDINAHIGKVVDAWITAYGGGGDSPVWPILEDSLKEIYAANGWPVQAEIGEVLPQSSAESPSTPTLDELLAACVKRASKYGKNTNAGNLPTYFEVRIKAMKGGPFGDFLTGDNSIDWAELDKTNVIFDFSGITSHEQRRFLFTTLTMQAASYLQFHKGLSSETQTVWAIDEASLIAVDTGDSDISRKHAVEMYAERQKVIGGYGVSFWNTMQSTEGVHPTLLSQNALIVTLALTSSDDKRDVLTNMGLIEGTKIYTSLFDRMTKFQAGMAVVWAKGMIESPKVVHITKPKEATAKQKALARTRMIRPPIVPNPNDHFTYAQHEEALKIATSHRKAWQQIFVGAVTIAHVAHTELPKKVPVSLARQWKREQNNPMFAQLIVYYIAKQAIYDRNRAIKRSYPSRQLLTSVVAHTVDLLNEKPVSEYVSPRFANLSLRQVDSYRQLTEPRFGVAPSPNQIVRPLPYRLPDPAETVDDDFDDGLDENKALTSRYYQTAQEQTTLLRQHHLSPFNDRTGKVNSETALLAAVGNQLEGYGFWDAMRLATKGEQSSFARRRRIAAALGYIATPNNPEESSLERVLALSSYVQRQLALAA